MASPYTKDFGLAQLKKYYRELISVYFIFPYDIANKTLDEIFESYLGTR